MSWTLLSVQPIAILPTAVAEGIKLLGPVFNCLAHFCPFVLALMSTADTTPWEEANSTTVLNYFLLHVLCIVYLFDLHGGSHLSSGSCNKKLRK